MLATAQARRRNQAVLQLARRIAANVAKLPEILRRRESDEK
jgi:hypothetical protein